jgi:hypothetical protein
MSDQNKEVKPTANSKGRPTPTRKEREAQNRKPLVGDRTKEGRAKANAAAREARMKAQAGMRAGDERYLPLRDRGPQKKLAREMVDGRFTIGEGLLPALLVLVVIASIKDPILQTIVTLVLWLAMVVVIIDGYLLSRKVQREIKKRLGENTVIERGMTFYVVMRCIQIRGMRIPKPLPRRASKKR